jgi:hypothetical protein
MADNTIESLSIALTGDASQLARDVEKAMQDTISTMEASAEEIRAANATIFEELIEDIRKAVDDPVFQQWQLQMEYFGKTAEDAAKFVSNNLGVALDGVVGKVAAAKDAVKALVEQQVQMTTQTAAAGGIAFSQEETQRVREQIEAIYELGGAYNGQIHTLKFLNEQIEIHRQGVIDEIRVEQMVAEALEITRAGYEALGQSMPIELTNTLEKRLTRLAKTAQEMGIPLKETSEEMKRIAEDNVPEAVKQYGNLEEKTRMVAEATAIATEAFKKLGMEMPITEADALEKKLSKIYDTGKRMGASTEKIWGNMKEASAKTIPEQTKGLGKLGQMFSGLASKVIAAAGAYVLLQKAGRFIKESMEQARVAIEETVRLTLAVREHQRAVGELSPTLAEANAQAEYLSDTYNLNRNATRRLVSESMLLTESLNFTNEQTKNLQESSVILSEILGKDALGVMKQLTNFLNTGYTQGLRDLGFQLDDHTLRIEAIKRGYIDYGDVLDETTMRMVGMAIIEERAAQAKEDLIQSQETITGQIKDQNIELEKQKEILGKFLIPIWDGVKLGTLKALTAMTQLLTIVTIKMYEFIGRMIARIQAFGDVVQAIQDMGISGVIEEYGGVGKAYGVMFEKRAEEMSETVRGALEDMLTAGTELGDEFGESLDKAGKAAEEFEDTVVAAMDGAVMAIDKLSKKYESDFLKAQTRLNQQLDKIDADFKRRREKMGLDLTHDLQDIERDSAESRLQTSRDFYNTEERERADHQLNMKRMEADYLMSLEDAVHERDARQVLSLRRKFAQDKKRANEDYNIAKKRRGEDFQLELAEIERQRVIRRNKRITQFNEEIVQLAEQEELKRKQAHDAFNARIEALNTRYNEMLRLEAEKLAASLGLNAEHLEALAKMLETAYGSSGFVVAYVQGISEWLAQQNLVLPTVGQQPGSGGYTYDPQSVQGGGTPISTTPIYGGGVQRRARGGTLFASSPTLVMAGEGGPERVDFSRLSQPGGGPRGGGGAGGPIEIALRVAMEDGLIAEITDQTMEGVAQVFVSIEGSGPRTAGRR